MNKYLPEELQNLAGSRARVIEHVEEQLQSKKSLKNRINIRFIGVAMVAVLMLAVATPLLLSENPFEAQKSAPISLTVGQHDEQLKRYFPHEGSVTHFSTEYDIYETRVFTYWLYDQYVQQIIMQGEIITAQIYRIANNQVDLVFDEQVSQDDEAIPLDKLNEMSSIETLIKAPFKEGENYGVWTMVNPDAMSSNLYVNLNNVIVLEKETESGFIRRYLSPEFGETKLEHWTVIDGHEELQSTRIMYYSSLTHEVLDDMPTIRFEQYNHLWVKAEFSTPWESLPSDSKMMMLEGRGEQGGEEGEGVIVIRDKITFEDMVLKLSGNLYSQTTPKEIVWIDENRLFVTVGMAYGMVTRGGDLYMLDLRDLSVIPIIVNKSVREEVSLIERLWGDAFNYTRSIYKTENVDTEDHYTVDGEISMYTGYLTDMNLSNPTELTITLDPILKTDNGIENRTVEEMKFPGDMEQLMAYASRSEGLVETDINELAARKPLVEIIVIDGKITHVFEIEQ